MARATTNTTEAGDTWDLLALDLLGDERYLDLLILANPAHAYLVRLPAGIVLNVPTVPTPDTSPSLPPWRTP